MKKVTLLGDSIRWIGYGTRVSELLGEDYVVFQPDENCRFAKYTLRGVMAEWKDDMRGSDIIHWNNGLWDTSDEGDGALSSPEEYVNDMLRLAEILKKRAKTVVFATTTPVRDAKADQSNERIIAYNNIIVPKLSAMGILINDLHSLVYPNIGAYIRTDDNIHLTDAGIEACAKQVANIIKESME